MFKFGRKTLFVIILVVALLGAFLVLDPFNFFHKTEEITLVAPSYATRGGVLEEATKAYGLEMYSWEHEPNGYLYFNTLSGDGQITAGTLGVLIAYPDLEFARESYSAWGQTCWPLNSDYFYVQENFLMIPVKATTDDPAFIDQCEKMLLPSVEAYVIEAESADGNYKINVLKKTISIKVTTKE